MSPADDGTLELPHIGDDFAGLKTMDEAALRAYDPPKFNDVQDLATFVNACVTHLNDDYGRAACAMSLASYATFSFVARQVGATGFQASCADLDFVRRTRLIEGPLKLLVAERALYPQYDLIAETREFLLDSNVAGWLASEAAKKLKASATSEIWANEAVERHWMAIVDDPSSVAWTVDPRPARKKAGFLKTATIGTLIAFALVGVVETLQWMVG